MKMPVLLWVEPMQENNEYSNVNPSGVEFTSKDSLRALGIRVISMEGVDEDLDAARHHGVDRTEQVPNYRRMTDLTRQEIDAKLAQNKAEVDARLANFDTSIKTGFAEIRAEFATLRADLSKQNSDFQADMAKLQTEVHKTTADLIKWGIGLAVAIVGMTVGLLTYIGKASEKPSPQATRDVSPSAPYVIAVPSGSALLTPPAPATTATQK